MKHTRLLPLAALTFTVFRLAAQTVPTTINFQGRLTDNTPAQTPLDLTANMQFEIWDVASGGAPGVNRLWREPNFDNAAVLVPVSNGIFSYVLGTTVPIPPAVFTGAGSTRYLQIILNPGGSQQILTPRQLVTASGYANLAENANYATAAASAASATNSAQLGGVAASGYLTTGGTAFDSARLGGTLASGWQKALATPACPANQFLTILNQSGTSVCAAAIVSEVDPKVGALTNGRIPRWNATSLTNGSLFDTGSRIGLGTIAPIAPFHVAGGSPAIAGSSNTGLLTPIAVHVQGRYAYVADYNNGSVGIFDVSNPAAPASVGSISTGLLNLNSIYVQGRYAYVISRTSNALRIIDVANPAAPATVGTLSTGVNDSSSVYVQGRYAYVASNGAAALVIVDVTNPAAPVVVASIGAGLSGPTGVYVQGRHAYVTSTFNEVLAIFDVANPAAPALVGSSSTGLSYPKAVSVQGRYAYVVSKTNSSLVIFDVANPAAPASVGTISTGLSSPDALFVQGRYAYVTSNNNDTVAVFDVSNPAAPVSVGATGVTRPQSIYVQGRYAYVASYGGGTLTSLDLGGAYVQQMEAGGIETGTLSTRSNAQVNGDAQVKGALAVGAGITAGGNSAIAGTLSIGVHLVACAITAPIHDCSCPAGETVISGGGYTVGAGNVIRESAPISPTTWRLSCANSGGTNINCNVMTILCARLAP